jgi:hypothetical protein
MRRGVLVIAVAGAITLMGGPAPGGASPAAMKALGILEMRECVPCQWDMPLMETLYRAYRDRGFVVLAISVDRGDAGRAR